MTLASLRQQGWSLRVIGQCMGRSVSTLMLGRTVKPAASHTRRAVSVASTPALCPNCILTGCYGVRSLRCCAGCARPSRLRRHSNACISTVRALRFRARQFTTPATPIRVASCAASSSRCCARARARAGGVLRARIGVARFPRWSASMCAPRARRSPDAWHSEGELIKGAGNRSAVGGCRTHHAPGAAVQDGGCKGRKCVGGVQRQAQLDCCARR